MKKIITVCLFVFGLFLATNTASAQQKFSAEINKAAQIKTVEVGKTLKTNKATQESMFIAYQEFYAKSETLKKSFQPGTSEYTDLETKITKRLSLQMNELLNDEQYTRYLKLSGLSANTQ